MCGQYVGAASSLILVNAVQIVDLKAGARVRIVSEPHENLTLPYATFRNKTAFDWKSWVLTKYTSPTGGALQGVTNGSFFMEPPGQTITRLSFPLKIGGSVQTSGQGCKVDATKPSGFDCTKPDDRQKRELGFYSGGAKAILANYNYVGTTYSSVSNELSSFSDGIVGLYPDLGYGDKAPRTYVGARDTDGNGDFDRLYILTFGQEITTAEATYILTSKFNTAANIQLDGGGSTQFESINYGSSIRSSDCAYAPIRNCRPVPTALAVYAAAP